METKDDGELLSSTDEYPQDLRYSFIDIHTILRAIVYLYSNCLQYNGAFLKEHHMSSSGSDYLHLSISYRGYLTATSSLNICSTSASFKNNKVSSIQLNHFVRVSQATHSITDSIEIPLHINQ